MTRCRSCGAAITWVETEHGRRMPLDDVPIYPVELRTLSNVQGLFALRVRGVGNLAIAATPDQLPGEPLYRSHFATCPQASSWRK